MPISKMAAWVTSLRSSAGEAMGFALAREGEKPTICFGRVCSAEPRLDGVSHSEILRGGIEF